jgi:sugar lactone lactonase YvrE
MSRVRVRLPFLFMLLVGVLLAGFALPGSASSRSSRSPDRIELPDGFQPEGIAIGSRPVAFFGSRVDGDIYRANLRNGRGRVFSQGPGTPSVGMKVGDRNRLFVAGGSGGDGRVVDTRSGRILASWSFAVAPTFINDVVLTDDAAWFTDSQRAQLYRVPLGRRLAAQSDVTTVPLGGDWQQVPGVTNANGIAETPDESALLVVQSSTGFLFRVDPDSGEAARVDLGDTVLANGDGLLVHRDTLYAVQNRLNQVAVIDLRDDGTRGELEDTLTSPDFDVPTTVARHDGKLYLPNARFGNLQPEPKPYWVTRITP